MKNIFIFKIPIKFLLFLFIVFSVSAYAEKEDWVSVGVIDNELWFVDIDSISCEANSCKVWVKKLSRTSAKKLPLEGEGYSKSLLDYNCTWMEYRIIETKRYDSSERIIKGVVPKYMNKKYKIQEPMDKKFHDIVCQKIVQQKESQRKTQVKEKQSKLAEENKKETTKKSSKKLSEPTETLKRAFTVQVGAFENVSYARSLKKVLNKKGYHTYILHTKKKGDLYKVCIGRFSDRGKAKALAEKIKSTEGYQAFVTTW